MRIIDKPQPPEPPRKPAPKSRPTTPERAGAADVGAAMRPPTHAPELVSEHGGGQGAAQGTPPGAPRFQGYQEPPNPILGRYGFNGGIQSFNDHVDRVVTAHQRAFGYDPPPGLVFDVVRSPLNIDEYDALFPGSRRINRLNQVVANYRAENPADHFVDRPDGYVQIHSPFAPGGKLGPGSAPTPDKKVIDMNKKYPMIPEGYLPVAGFHDVVSAVEAVDKFSQTDQPLEVAGKKLRDIQKEYEQSGGSMSTAEAIAAQRPAARAMHGTYTVKQAQEDLQKVSPTYFGDLPVTGTINSDWAGRIRQYQHTPSYQRDSVRQLAKDNYLSVPKFLDAWHNKQSFVQKHGAFALMAQAIPLTWWAKHADVGDLMRYWTGGAHGIDLVAAPLHVLTQATKFAFSAASGTVNQTMADTAAMNAFLQKMAPAVWGKDVSVNEAGHAAAKVVRENPSVLRMFAPLQTPAHEKGVLAVADELATLGALVVTGHPRITGMKVLPGDVAKLSNHPFFNFATRTAYNSVKKGEPLGVAIKPLEGAGGEALAVALKRNPKMTLDEFRAHAADLYHHGEANLETGSISGPIFRSMRTTGLPTPTQAGVGAQKFNKALTSTLDKFEAGAKQGGFRSRSHAVDFIRYVRSEFSRAAPESETRRIFGAEADKTPDDIFNWAQRNLKDVTVAHNLRDQFIEARAKDDVSGALAVEQRMKELYAAKYPDRATGERELFAPLIKSDLPAEIYFPGSAIGERATRINKFLNKIAGKHRTVITAGGFPAPIPIPFGGGESLAWKHAVDDSARAVIGGRSIFGLSKNGELAKTELEAQLATDADLRRVAETSRLAAREGEFRWLTRKRGSDQMTFRTFEHQDSAPHWNAAGDYLRRHLNDGAMDAFTRSSRDNLEPLVGYSQQKAIRQGILMRKPEYDAGLKQFEEQLGSGQLALDLNTGKTVKGNEAAGKAIRRNLAEDHAEAIYKRYLEMQGSLQSAGVSLEHARGVAGTGKDAGKKLGQWLRENNVDLPVRHGLVYEKGTDDVMTRWIGTLMTANKWNRGKLYDHVLYETLGDLRKAGWNMKQAVPVASDVAMRQTVYHMLDFSNMLQAEQDFRWLSYFATKHRLYWSWIGKTFIRRPTLAAALTRAKDDIGVDDKGNLNFKIAGHDLYVPAYRLLWINSHELPEVSTLALGAQGFAQGIEKTHSLAGALTGAGAAAGSTFGNVLTRDDQAWLAWFRVAQGMAGHAPATFQAATAGMAPSTKRDFAHLMVEFALAHEKDGKIPTEVEAVKYAALHVAVRASWSSNLPAPVLWKNGPSPRLHKLYDEYGAILSPVKKAAFLDSHPELRLHFGQSDPDVWWHTTPLWAKFNALRHELDGAKKPILEHALVTGALSTDDMKKLRDAGAKYAKGMELLKEQDAEQWRGNKDFPAGKVVTDNGVTTVKTPGPWGRQLEPDPFAARAFIHEAFPNIPKAELDKHTVGDMVIHLRKELALLRQPDGWRYDGLKSQKDVGDRIGHINQVLAPFNAYPKDALSKAEHTYYNDYVTPYRTQRIAKSAQGQTIPSDQKDKFYGDFRAWRDAHDHPVTITVNGKTVRFPSVVRMGYAMMPEPQRRAAIAKFAGDNFLHLSGYELNMLGINTPKDFSVAQQSYDDALAKYRKNPGMPPLKQNQLQGLAKEIGAYYPGYYQFWLTSNKPKLERFQLTTYYRTMEPDAKAAFDKYIVPSAKKAIGLMRNGYGATAVKQYWRAWVEDPGFVAWVKTEPALAKALAELPPDFLQTLVSSR